MARNEISQNSVSEPPKGVRSAARVLGRSLRQAWEELIWGDVRAGTVNLEGTPLTFRLLVRLGIWLVVGGVALSFFDRAWRARAELWPIFFGSDSLSGTLVPRSLVPVVIGALVLAWTYLLVGALHARWWVKLGVLGVFGLFEAQMLLTLLASSVVFVPAFLVSALGGSDWTSPYVIRTVLSAVGTLCGLVVHLGCGLVLLAVFVWRRKRPVQLGLEAPIVLVLVGGLWFSAYGVSTLVSHPVNVALPLHLATTFGQISILLTPFLFITGAEVVGLGVTIARTMTRGARWLNTRRPLPGRWLWGVVLCLFLVGRAGLQWLKPSIDGDLLSGRWGAAVVALPLLGLSWAIRRRRPREGVPAWVIPVMALVISIAPIVPLIAMPFAMALVFLFPSGGRNDAVSDLANRFIGALPLVMQWYLVGLGGVALVVALILWWRRRDRSTVPALALYVSIFGAWRIWYALTRPEYPLGHLRFAYADFSAVMTLVLLALAILSGVRRHWPVPVLSHLTAAAVLSWLLELADWLGDPLSPVAAVLNADQVFLGLGILLGIMAAGQRFALNVGSPRFPRYSRALLYLGCALMMVITVNWFAIGHDVAAQALRETADTGGYTIIGVPLAFALIMARSPELVGDDPAPA